MFQSQTGSQALSDVGSGLPVHHDSSCFNPKREARPSQTMAVIGVSTGVPRSFQSQTGSQALSDDEKSQRQEEHYRVSIPNGKPGPLRPMKQVTGLVAVDGFNPKREARPSQTQYGALSPARD